MQAAPYLLVAVLGYLIGSIPVGYLLGRLRGVDVRRYGSGRTGATNVLRSAGGTAAGLTVVSDILKGVAAVLIARYVLDNPWGEVLTGIAAIIGHRHSIFIGFQGGAGVLVALGMLLVFSPFVAIVFISIGLGIVALSHYVSLASMTMSALAPVALLVDVLVNDQPLAYFIWGLVAATLIVYSHRPNIQRLLAGTERHLGEPAKPTEHR